MRDKEHGHLPLELVDRGSEMLRSLGIQAAGGLVEEQYLGAFKQGTGNSVPELDAELRLRQ